jgi:hypothetical protein
MCTGSEARDMAPEDTIRRLIQLFILALGMGSKSKIMVLKEYI